VLTKAFLDLGRALRSASFFLRVFAGDTCGLCGIAAKRAMRRLVSASLLSLDELAMNNPWDIPPLPTVADEDIEITYSGIGRVTSAWEGIEVNLGRIYSFLLEDPDGYETMRKYGEGRIFKDRFKELQRAADQFFFKRHDQQIEGEFHHLAIKVVGFSDRRNDVAHSIVNPIHLSLESTIGP
jgi:hypothetical protein